MSKRDYQDIARAIHNTRQTCPAFSQHCDGTQKSPQDILAEFLLDALAATNSRFDRARFIEACETGRCKGMRG